MLRIIGQGAPSTKESILRRCSQSIHLLFPAVLVLTDGSTCIEGSSESATTAKENCLQLFSTNRPYRKASKSALVDAPMGMSLHTCFDRSDHARAYS